MQRQELSHPSPITNFFNNGVFIGLRCKPQSKSLCRFYLRPIIFQQFNCLSLRIIRLRVITHARESWLWSNTGAPIWMLEVKTFPTQFTEENLVVLNLTGQLGQSPSPRLERPVFSGNWNFTPFQRGMVGTNQPKLLYFVLVTTCRPWTNHSNLYRKCLPIKQE